jgi:hypothetical protein
LAFKVSGVSDNVFLMSNRISSISSCAKAICTTVYLCFIRV